MLQSDLDRVLQPTATARGLPNEYYTGADVHEAEKRVVFFANWVGLGFAKDIPQSGDAKPYTFLGLPLFAVRDKTGQVRVYQNTCRHRGMILIDEPTRITGAIRCPYHSWCYDLNGALKATPHVGGPGQNTHPDLDRDGLGLFEIRCHVWRDVIFINVSGDAPAFEEAAADIQARWSEFERPLYHSGADSSFSLDLACNWKLAVENYCESYHLPWIHPSLNTYSRLEDHYNIVEADKFSGQGTLVYSPMLGEEGQSFGDFEGLSSKWDKAAEYLSFYPNVLFGVHRDHAFTILLEPQGAEKLVEHIEIYYAQESDLGDEHAELRQRNTTLWRGVFEEDMFVVEGMQCGRHGVKFDGGAFSPAMDGPTHEFHRWIARQFGA
jgi:phenylpropionate dioxygenase-like ring-hydroxylating dioxygenase large terminal subunit